MIKSVLIVLQVVKAYLKKDCHFGRNLKTKYLCKEERHSKPSISFVVIEGFMSLIEIFSFFFLLLASTLPFVCSEIIMLFDFFLLPW